MIISFENYNLIIFWESNYIQLVQDSFKNEKVNLILSDVQDQYVELDYNYILDFELYCRIRF